MGLKKKDKAFTNSSKQCCDAHCSGYNVTETILKDLSKIKIKIKKMQEPSNCYSKGRK